MDTLYICSAIETRNNINCFFIQQSVFHVWQLSNNDILAGRRWQMHVSYQHVVRLAAWTKQPFWFRNKAKIACVDLDVVGLAHPTMNLNFCKTCSAWCRHVAQVSPNERMQSERRTNRTELYYCSQIVQKLWNNFWDSRTVIISCLQSSACQKL